MIRGTKAARLAGAHSGRALSSSKHKIVNSVVSWPAENLNGLNSAGASFAAQPLGA
jgi:hypothetical protein